LPLGHKRRVKDELIVSDTGSPHRTATVQHRTAVEHNLAGEITVRIDHLGSKQSRKGETHLAPVSSANAFQQVTASARPRCGRAIRSPKRKSLNLAHNVWSHAGPQKGPDGVCFALGAATAAEGWFYCPFARQPYVLANGLGTASCTSASWGRLVPPANGAEDAETVYGMRQIVPS